MPSLGTFALLTAAFLLAELFQRSDDELLPELDGERFSLSAPVHVAAIIVLGAWPAALIGLVGTVAVRPLKGEPWRKSLARGAGLGVAALAGGLAFQLAGSTPGEIHVSEDLLAIAVLGMVYGAIRSLGAALVGRRLLPQADVLTTAAEVGLGLLLAFAALENPWLAAALAPVLLLLDQIYARLGRLRREMAMALETFANIVDERDPTTHGHSLRVAQYVRELADGLGLPHAEASRLWWAGRLHDLGKVAVDAAVLRKPGLLDEASGPLSVGSATLGAPPAALPFRGRAGAGGRVSPRALRRLGLLRRAAHRPATRRTLPDRGGQLRRDDHGSPVQAPPPDARRSARGDRARERHTVSS